MVSFSKKKITNGSFVETWYIFYRNEKGTSKYSTNSFKFFTQDNKPPSLTMDPNSPTTSHDMAVDALMDISNTLGDSPVQKKTEEKSIFG